MFVPSDSNTVSVAVAKVILTSKRFYVSGTVIICLEDPYVCFKSTMLCEEEVLPRTQVLEA